MTTRVITIADVIGKLEAWAPPATAASYDNPGLQVGRGDQPVSTGLVALDLTPAVVAEAEDLGAQLIVTHHPLFFAPIKSLTPTTLVGGMGLTLAEKGIAHYAIHTNLDAARGGVSFALAELLGLKHRSFLLEHGTDLAHPELLTGTGTIGELDSAISTAEFLDHVAASLHIPALRFVGDPDQPVRRVAVCGGSGSSFLGAALDAGVDAYVTGDVKYHQFFDALDPEGLPRLAYLDVGHYESEAVTEPLLVDYLTRHFPGLRWSRTARPTSPVQSYVRG